MIDIIYIRLAIRRTNEKILQWIAWHLPKSLIYWSGIRLWAHATSGEYGDTIAPNIKMDEVLRRWTAKPKQE